MHVYWSGNFRNLASPYALPKCYLISDLKQLLMLLLEVNQWRIQELSMAEWTEGRGATEWSAKFRVVTKQTTRGKICEDSDLRNGFRIKKKILFGNICRPCFGAPPCIRHCVNDDIGL